jgi:hypothetical protein
MLNGSPSRKGLLSREFRGLGQPRGEKKFEEKEKINPHGRCGELGANYTRYKRLIDPDREMENVHFKKPSTAFLKFQKHFSHAGSLPFRIFI